MTCNNCAVFLMVFSFLWMIIPGRADAEVSCVFMERCVLPCRFQSGSDVFIHWIQGTAGIRVHSYYHNKDQPGDQDQHFRNKTSLFKDQVSRGNASLQLTGVTIQDQGRYKCLTSTFQGSQDSFVILKVDALVHKIIIQQEGNRLTCSSGGIYPEPELTWSTSPPSSISTNNNTTVRLTEQQLYNISSFLILPNSDMDLNYSCAVSTRRNRRRATLRQQASVTGSQSEAIIHCSLSSTSVTNLIWRFNHSQIILRRTETDRQYAVSDEWMQHVKDVSESGSLTLQDLSSDQEGTYTCEISDAVETRITNTFLKLDSIQDRRNKVIPVLIVLLLIVAVLLICYCKKKKDHQKKCKEPRNAKRREVTQIENSEAARGGQGEDTTTAMLHHNGEIPEEGPVLSQQ